MVGNTLLMVQIPVSDPRERYELFKKMDRTLNHAVISPRPKQPHRKSYFEGKDYYFYFCSIQMCLSGYISFTLLEGSSKLHMNGLFQKKPFMGGGVVGYIVQG